MEQQNVYEKPVTLKNFKICHLTIAMSVFMSFYTMVDGLFVSNLIGTDALSAINLTAPIIQLVTAVSTMLATAAASFFLTRPLAAVFARPDNPVYDLAVMGNRICTIALLFIGFNIFANGMFTALSNGVVSAVLAFSRSFVFMLIAMLMLPHFLGVNGVWMATPAAELMALALSAGMFIIYRKRYQY